MESSPKLSQMQTAKLTIWTIFLPSSPPLWSSRPLNKEDSYQSSRTESVLLGNPKGRIPWDKLEGLNSLGAKQSRASQPWESGGQTRFPPKDQRAFQLLLKERELNCVDQSHLTTAWNSSGMPPISAEASSYSPNIMETSARNNANRVWGWWELKHSHVACQAILAFSLQKQAYLLLSHAIVLQ